MWRRRAWRATADLWIDRSLGTRTRTGRSEQIHVVPWSTVFRVPTDRGAVFFKAPWPLQRFEAGVSEALAKWAPSDVGVLIAVDKRRGLMLFDDAGEKLRGILKKDRDIRHWHRALPQYAELQLRVAPHAKRLIALGAADRRAATLSRQYERLLEESARLRVGLNDGLKPAQHRKLQALVPQVREWCDAIASSVPDSIQHDDLHDGQVFVRDGRYRILDWGDACVSNPLYSLTIVLRSAAYTLRVKESAPEIQRLVDIYLEPFTTIATRRHLRETYAIASRLACLCRALTWAEVLARLPPVWLRRERGNSAAWLRIFLDRV